MIPGLKDAEDLFRCQDCRYRIKSSGQRLADDQDVGLNAFVHAGKHFARTAESRLDLVSHQQHSVLAANLGRFAQESFTRNDNSRLALNRLQQKSASVRGNRRAQRSRIAKWNHAETRGERPEAILVLFFG